MMGDSFAALGQKEDALKSYNIAAKVEEATIPHSVQIEITRDRPKCYVGSSDL